MKTNSPDNYFVKPSQAQIAARGEVLVKINARGELAKVP